MPEFTIYSQGGKRNENCNGPAQDLIRGQLFMNTDVHDVATGAFSHAAARMQSLALQLQDELNQVIETKTHPMTYHLAYRMRSTCPGAAIWQQQKQNVSRLAIHS